MKINARASTCGISALALAAYLALFSPVLAVYASPVKIGGEAVSLTSGARVLEPKSPGTVTYSGGGATIDASNVSQGYVMVKYSGSDKIKVRIVHNGKSDYKYDLAGNGKYEVLPLTCGNGSYMIGVYKNVSGNSYAELLSKTIQVNLSDQLLPFLYPSQYVNFNANSKAVAKSDELIRGASSDIEVISDIYNYVIGNISYDSAKAASVVAGELTGYLPSVDSVLAAGKGICFDYAALMAAMLRSQQIPTRLEVGYVSGGAYHAWISTYISEVGWVNGVIQFDGKNWRMMDPTFASSGGGSSEIMKYIGNGSNYKTQYIY